MMWRFLAALGGAFWFIFMVWIIIFKPGANGPGMETAILIVARCYFVAMVLFALGILWWGMRSAALTYVLGLAGVLLLFGVAGNLEKMLSDMDDAWAFGAFAVVWLSLSSAFHFLLFAYRPTKYGWKEDADIWG